MRGASAARRKAQLCGCACLFVSLAGASVAWEAVIRLRHANTGRYLCVRSTAEPSPARELQVMSPGHRALASRVPWYASDCDAVSRVTPVRSGRCMARLFVV